MWNRALSLASLCVGLLSVSVAFGDGLILNGISPRSIGRGGTNIGFSDNGAAWFDNPAAAANISKRTLFDAGLDLLVTDFQYSDPDNSSTSSTDFTPVDPIGVHPQKLLGAVGVWRGFIFPGRVLRILYAERTISLGRPKEI